MAGLYGTYQHSLDAKGRIALPAPFRKVLPEDVLLVVSPDDALMVFDEDEFEGWHEQVFAKDGGYDPRNRRHAQIDQMLFGRMASVSIDSAGRVNIPENLRVASGLEKDAVVVGCGTHLEMWDPARRERFMAGTPSLSSLFYTEDE